jgi:prolyl 4-hydroxylase
LAALAQVRRREFTTIDREKKGVFMLVTDETWESWLALNAIRGCSPESMVEAMVSAGFEKETADAAVRRTLQDGSRKNIEARARPRVEHHYEYDPSRIATGNVLQIDDRKINVLIRCERPEIVVFDAVLTPDECEQIIERSRHRLERSTTVNPETGEREVIANRSSEGIWFRNGEDAFIAGLEQRFAALMNCDVENGEGLQVMRYGVGGEYRPHFDYFPPSQRGSAVHLSHGGQRVATLILYLNDPESGGETIFPEAGISVVPRRGGAVYFRYMNALGQLDALTLHGGAPVLSGEKWIMTKWVRESRFQ